MKVFILSLKVLFILLLQQTLLNPAFACSCIQLSESAALEKADVAFVGTAKSSVKSGKTGTTIFLVSKWLKPAKDTLTEVSIVHELSPGLCSLEFAAGAKYRVYAEKSEDSGKLSAHLCSGTSLLNDSVEIDE